MRTRWVSMGMFVGIVGTLAAAGCSTWSPPRATMAKHQGCVQAVYVCDPEAILLVERAGRPALIAASQAWTATNAFRDAAGDHFVQVAWGVDDGRVAVEYVIPAQRERDAEVRVFDRAAGADYVLVRREDGALGVSGEPSERHACRAEWHKPNATVAALDAGP